jgi:hypothetical protein
MIVDQAAFNACFERLVMPAADRMVLALVCGGSVVRRQRTILPDRRVGGEWCFARRRARRPYQRDQRWNTRPISLGGLERSSRNAGRTRTIHLGNDDPWLHGRGLHGISAEAERRGA